MSRPISKDRILRYKAGLKTMETRKRNRGGIIGITYSEGRWIVTFPSAAGARVMHAKTAMEAALTYNRRVTEWFGDMAVLCDVKAALRLDAERMKA